MDQIVAAVILFGIITIVFAPIILESGSQIFSNSVSVSDIMEKSRLKTGQILVSTRVEVQDDTTTVYLSNIGIEDVRIETVLLDGHESGYILRDQDSRLVSGLDAGDLGMLDVSGTGDTMHVITDTGKLFEFVP